MGTTDNLVVTNAQTEATTMLAQAQQVAAAVPALSISNAAEYLQAGQGLVEIKSRWKAVEEKRTSLVKPLNDVVKNINAMFKPVLDQWDTTMDVVKRAMHDYQVREADAQRKALEAAATMAQQGQTGQEFHALVAQGSAMPAKLQGITSRVIWRWKVTDAALVPREYLCVDASKLDAVVKEAKEGVKIPGIEVYREEVIAVRTS
jgi:BMFP domain-containing protein YqiC